MFLNWMIMNEPIFVDSILRMGVDVFDAFNAQFQTYTLTLNCFLI
jgi:hypothetical protein